MRISPIQRTIEVLFTYPRRSLLAVLAFIVVAAVVGGPVAGDLDAEGGFTPGDADSVQAIERAEQATGQGASPGVLLLVETPPGSSGAAEEVAAELAMINGVAEVVDGGPSIDGSSALVLGTLEADASVADVATDVAEVFADEDTVVIGGPAAMSLQLGEQIGEDLARAELFAFPLLVLLSIVFFKGRAAVLPLVVGIATVLGTFLAMAAVNSVYGLSVFALNLVIGLGIGLAVDYTLFLVSRYREELEIQGPTAGAIATTMRTAGRTVVYSSTTVAVALATLAIFPMGFLRSMGISGALVAVVAAIAALVISPAVFAVWGAKLARRGSSGSGEATEGRWHRLAHVVMRRPGVIALSTAAIMLLLAAPALRANWTPVDQTVIPEDLSSRVVSDRLADEYVSSGGAVTMAVSSADAGEVSSFAAAVSELPAVTTDLRPVQLDDETWHVEVTIEGDPGGEMARGLVADVRAVADSTGTDALVGGAAAEFLDQQEAIADTLPIAVGLLMMLTMLALWLMTGSVILPIKAVAMNVLTVGVSLGAITFIYQDGRLTDLLGYTPNGGVEPSNFLIAAALVFALSTDYGVFLLGRIKEARDAGLSERDAVATGLGRTGSVVTAAAILLAVAIGAFSTSEISFLQQIGIATSVGILVDAFVVRSLLVPSLMALMGKWNWWAPMWLRRVHDRVGLREGETYPVRDEKALVP